MQENDDDFAMLVGTLVKTAQHLLKQQRGEFFPFSAYIDADGKPAILSADLGIERPQSSEMIKTFQAALQAQANSGKIRACGICANVAARLPGYEGNVDAICCFLARKSGSPVDFYAPFRRGWLGRYRLFKPIALPGTSTVFVPSAE